MCWCVFNRPLCSPSELNKNPIEGFSVGLKDDANIYEWNVMMEGPADTLL